MRTCFGTSSAQTDPSHFDVRRMANDMESTLGCAALQTEKSVYDQRNYRGIHLTSQISKVAERVIAALFVPQLICSGAVGRNQFAYMPERGARDAFAQLVLFWISLFGRKRKIAVYCSDVSGAFDKVNSRRLLQKTSRTRSSNENFVGNPVMAIRA